MKSLIWLDPGLGSENAGDEVISEAVGVIDQRLRTATRISTHRHPSFNELKLVKAADIVVVGGSNILSSHMERHRQWWIAPPLAAALWQKCVFVGVGWWQYQSPPCRYSRWLLRGISSPAAVHAARDEYTARRIRAMGLQVEMTSCPTMWSLPRTLPQTRADSAVVTVTNYHRDGRVDAEWLNSVAASYRQIVAIGMEAGDRDYLKLLGLHKISNATYGGTGLSALSEVLRKDVEYVGTRLHGGVHALNHGRRSLILSVDNRAVEIANTTGLPVVARNNLGAIGQWMEVVSHHELKLPVDSIRSWQEWFRKSISDREFIRIGATRSERP